MTIRQAPSAARLFRLATGVPVFPSSLSSDGVWTWFSGPRAVAYQGTRSAMYAQWATHTGDVVVGAVNLTTGVVDTPFVLHAALQVDDHVNGAVMVRPDGRILCFYSTHNDSVVRARLSTNPEDISSFGAEYTPITNITRNGGAYSNPYRLSAEADRIYYFFRGTPFNPTMSVSDDGGATFSGSNSGSYPKAGETHLFAPLTEAGSGGIRPYAQYCSDGVRRFDVIATYGHPREEAGHNHLYHFYYLNAGSTPGGGSFYKSDGTLIRSLATLRTGLPILGSEATKVADYSENGDTWTWSIELDTPTGRPVATWVAFNDARTVHMAMYGRLLANGTWEKHQITDLGGSIYPGPEQEYSPGVMVDPYDTSVVWLCKFVSGVPELQKWTTSDGGTSWSSVAVTTGSTGKNFRPFVPRNRIAGITPAVVWPSGTYTSYTNWNTAVKLA